MPNPTEAGSLSSEESNAALVRAHLVCPIVDGVMSPIEPLVSTTNCKRDGSDSGSLLQPSHDIFLRSSTVVPVPLLPPPPPLFTEMEPPPCPRLMGAPPFPRPSPCASPPQAIANKPIGRIAKYF